MKEFYKETDIQIAQFAKALSNPARVAILRLLVENSSCQCDPDTCSCGGKCEGKDCKCGCNCGTIADQFPMAQSTISQHIKELKSAGLINISCRKGKYTLNKNKINEGILATSSLFNQLKFNVMEENKHCSCGENCNCGPDCKCDENCNCGPECKCGENCNCGPECNCH